jgi:hypothetical protein
MDALGAWDLDPRFGLLKKFRATLTNQSFSALGFHLINLQYSLEDCQQYLLCPYLWSKL